MKVFLYQDTRSQINLGCKATTSSLIDMIISNGDEIIHYSDLSEFVGLRIFKKIHFLKKFLLYGSNIRYFLRKIFFSLQELKKDKLGSNTSFKDFDKLSKLILQGKIYQKEHKALKEADVLIVNGEGSIYADQAKGIYCFFWCYFVSVYLKKPTALVNHHSDLKTNIMLELAENVYPLINSVVFRDQYSMKKAQIFNTMNNFSFAGDAAFTYEDQFEKKYLNYADCSNLIKIHEDYICVGGSSSIMRPDQKNYFLEENFKLLIKKLMSLNLKIVLVSADNTDDFLLKKISDEMKLEFYSSKTGLNEYIKILENARCLISGRWHSAILASRGGTPTVAMSSNSKKMKGFNLLFDLNSDAFNIMSLEKNGDHIVAKTAEYINKGQNFRDIIAQKATYLKATSIKNISILKKT